MNGEEIRKRLDEMNTYIKTQETYLRTFGFLACEYSNLRWEKDKNNNWRIMLNEKPLLEVGLEERLNNSSKISGLIKVVEEHCSEEILKLDFLDK